MGMTPAELVEGIVGGDRRTLARAITLVESSRQEDRERATQLLDSLPSQAEPSLRVGVSGVPGVGKSTLIEKLGLAAIDRGHRVAVLAVDPSSALSGGSILGDKTRMPELSLHPQGFVRPSPTGGTLGGVTRRSRETLALCEAAGYDLILVETVGVGQSETAVSEMTDVFLLLLLPGGGDELQGIKRGIMELADIVVVNKADGELKSAANRAEADYRNAIGLLAKRWESWDVPVMSCSALEGAGIENVYESLQDFFAAHKASGQLGLQRREQAKSWLWQETGEILLNGLRHDPKTAAYARELEQAVANSEVLPTVAAHRLAKAFYRSKEAK